MFSFNERNSIKPIAEIVGGDKDGKILYLKKKEFPMPRDCFDNIQLKSGKFDFIPDIRDEFTDVINITAPRGAGKSTYAAHIAEKLKNMFRLQKGDIIIVKKNKLIDKAFDSLNGNYIYLDQDFINEIPKCDTLASPDGKPRVILIDDCDGLQSSKLKKAYIEFLNDVVTAGRKYNLYVIVCAHALANKTETKMLLSETSYFTFFPESTTSDIRYALETYCDISKDFLKEMKNYPTKWIMFHQSSPRFILTENRAFIFDLDREDERIKTKKKILKQKIEKKIDSKSDTETESSESTESL